MLFNRPKGIYKVYQIIRKQLLIYLNQKKAYEQVQNSVDELIHILIRMECQIGLTKVST